MEVLVSKTVCLLNRLGAQNEKCATVKESVKVF